jgi:hypothetical protein
VRIDNGFGAVGDGAEIDAGAVDAGSCIVNCDAAESPAGGILIPVVTPWIYADPIVLVKRAYTSPSRKKISLSVDDSGFDGSGTLTISKGAIRCHVQATGRVISSGHTFDGPELAAGVHLTAEGVSPSAAMDDVVLALTLTPGSKPVKPPATAKITVVEVTLDIFSSRTAAGVDPAMLTVAQKTSKHGRIVHVQDTGRHHGRALVIVRKAVPAVFPGTLTLKPETASVRVFADPQEVPAPGQAPLATVHLLPNSGISASGTRLWVEGADVSAAVGDTGLRLGVQGVSEDGDRIKMTVVQFSDLQATLPSSQPNQVRMGNGPVQKHTPFGGGHAAANYDESLGANPPLVLVGGSLAAGRPVELSVKIRPRVPVRWSVRRNRVPGTVDHAKVVALSPNPVPTLSTPTTDSLTATLRLDAAGFFHICPFVDIDGGGHLEDRDPAGNRIDREPFILMTLVLLSVRSFQNNSRARTTRIRYTPTTPTAATGFRLATGTFANAAAAAVHNDALVTIVGGGPDGRLGLDRLFGGWVNNELTVGTSTTVPPGEDVDATYVDTTTTPPTTHHQKSIWTSVGGGSVFMPGTVPGPAGISGPVLDVSNFGNEGTGGNRCVGTETWVSPGPRVPIAKSDLPVGQRWRIQMWDSPGDTCPPAHPAFLGSLRAYRFNLDFRSYLCLWTNVTGVAGPTPGPLSANADAACRLYSLVQVNQWEIRIAFSFHPVTGAGTNTHRNIRMIKDADPGRKAMPLEGTGLETRAPISLNLLALDART